ncbi:hypothetical protein TSUD_120350 [Trifolium subterraneum]|uniref:LRR and NB-ARC domain disease resistance protein n=1 Tax=Trifolium subterraneum TaxID=3900 RepID=A0A2Z6MDA5_TRISU|nr:hypothetical protein TSUD_120350 [Trifolium subterraneum]
MAELVTGAFLSSFFQVIFDRLVSSNFTDYFRRGKLDESVEELKSTLDSINQVLDDAEIKQYQIPNVKKWLCDVKHAMYEADQLLDEIATDAPLKKLKAESQPSTSNIFNFISTFTNPFESRIKELIKSLHSLAEQKDKLQLKNQTYAGNVVGFNSKPSERPTTYLVDASGIYGRDGDKEEMIKVLLSENGGSNQTPIISIVGLGGMGKTTLAKLVYNDNKIKEHFEHTKAWVYVSDSFNVVGLTKAILKSFGFSADGEDLNLLQHQLQHKLTDKKYLLVLDDIWNGKAECWEQLLLPFNHGSSGSKIIVTTRDKGVADVLNSKLFDLQQLDKNDCWSLFVTHAFRDKKLCEYPNLESIGKKIVDKCGGLPLAVKTLGQLLRRKFFDHEWRKILETDMWQFSDEDNNINPVLRLSYHNLPSNRKRCFAYCSIFPKGYEFDRGELIRFWMAEGLLKGCKAYKSEEEFGSEIFSDLESISFFQKSLNYRFAMHDLVNDLAKSVSGEFGKKMDGAWVEGNLERTRHVWCSLRLNCVDKLLGPKCEVKGLRSLILRHNTMLISNNVQRDLFSRLTCLRMLSFRGCCLSELDDEIGNLKLLRYLDLSYNSFTALPDTICKLYNLQTLLLKGFNKLTELPSNFSKLINLRHLELPFGLKKMPKNIGNLINLQTLNYFIVEEQNGSGIKELAKMNNLHGTIKITGLGNVIDHEDAAKANLKDKKYLEELYMVFDGRREEMNDPMVESIVSVLEALEPNCNLKKLTIENYNGNRFPNWLMDSHLPNLVSLELKNCGLCSDLPSLDQLPLLKKLYIRECPKLKASIPKGDSMIELHLEKCDRILVNGLSSRLKKFVLSENRYTEFSMEQNLVNCMILEELDLDVRGFVNCPSLDLSCYNSLRDLSIRGWHFSSSLPFSLHLFTNLRTLKLYDCPQLESFGRGGLPSNLIYLKIENCPKLIGSREEWGLFQLNSLQTFIISDEFENVESFPEENLLPPTLYELYLIECSKLRIMNYKGFLHLNSLYRLYIWDCPSLESLPEEGLPSSRSNLLIEECPIIREKYKKEGGERWHTIRHIPEVYIDWIKQHDHE